MNKEEIKIYIPKKTDLDWIDFIIGTKDHPPRDLTKRAFGWVKNKSRALDIGGAALNDTKYLLGKGLRVDVVDVENITLDLSKSIDSAKLKIHLMPIEKYDLGSDKYNIIVANYVLPFIDRENIKLLLKNIHNSLKNNGIFCGTFFGKNDFYRNNPDISFHTKKQIIKMLDGYEILYFSEVEKECLNYSGKLEHYHSFEFIVKKKYKYRKGSAAIVLNSKNEILLVNLESFEDKYFTVAGGGQDFGETLLNSAHRELKEELNISDEDLEFVGVCKKPLIFNFVKPTMRDGVEYVGSEKFYFGFRFIGEEKNIIPNKGEVRSYKWVKYKDLKNYLLFGSQLLDTQEKIKELFPSFKENQY